jgi:hypothetical protein
MTIVSAVRERGVKPYPEYTPLHGPLVFDLLTDVHMLLQLPPWPM